MNVDVSLSKPELGTKAARCGAEVIRAALAARGESHVILATGASQFEMLSALLKEEGIDWSRVSLYHLDEYVDMPESHPASFRKYLRERFIDKLPTSPRAFYPVSKEELAALNAILAGVVIDVAFVGIGENGHLAFNDPPADFDVETPFFIVQLDDDCRKQQLGEGWFASFDDVPIHAVTMSIRQIMKSRVMIVSVPDTRKAKAVKGALEGSVTPACPASILQRHPACHIFLDSDSASLLSRK